MSERNDTAPAAETDLAEPTSITAALDARDSHQATPDHETELEVGAAPEPKPAPAPAAAAAAPAATPAPVAETVDPATKPEAEGPFWYRKAIKAEREARQAAEARATAAERRPAPQQEREPTEAEDPNRPMSWAEVNAIRERDALVGRLERSEERFVDKLGEESFEATREWLATRPDIEEWALKQRDPWKAAHSQFTKEKLAAEIGEDPAAWKEAERARLRAEILAEQESEERHEPARREPPPQMRPKPPAAASTARSAAPTRERDGRFAGPTPISAALKR